MTELSWHRSDGSHWRPATQRFRCWHALRCFEGWGLLPQFTFTGEAPFTRSTNAVAAIPLPSLAACKRIAAAIEHEWHV